MIPGEGAAAKFLLDASRLYNETCPELSRFFMQYAVKSNETSKKRFSILSNNMSACPSCYQLLRPDNHRVRLRPKQRPPARVQSVLRRKARGKRLSLVQKYLLHRFQNSSSVLMATCHTCNTTSRHKGMNREFLTTLAKTHSTPGSAVKHKTPQSTSRTNMTTPKTPGKDKTPVHTPRSSTSSNTSGSGSSSSKPPSKPKNWVVQRLSKILMREDTQGSKKGGLKDFLSSL
ncbi:UPF0711 protein C18orf21 homolog isoform X1 [Larimichthys crocea]|uniref:UPF0711 protein C18orf21 homolog isoform X1 n=1 Tax=Larimichthys crocea TaxID=215358 RepID=UPI00054C21E7|nr:UPF0711 protein C18orf21 homolog isoform X1 [Larimichthys crocea]